MRLRKWYLDCTTEDGCAAVLYWAHLSVGRVRLRYAAALLSLPDQPPSYRWVLRAGAEPGRSERGVLWSCPGLRCAGVWKPTCKEIDQRLLETEEGGIRWRCIAPGADVELTLDGREFRGRGYAELLEMSIQPSRLPIEELRWGRFLSERQSVVWIQWTGAAPRRDVYLNGTRVEAEPITDGVVYIQDGATIRLGDSRVLREGELGATVLRRIPRLGSIAPARMLATREIKWLSRGQLQSPSTGCVETGWAIHEVVRFGRVDSSGS